MKTFILILLLILSQTIYSKPLLVVDDPKELIEIESKGFAFFDLIKPQEFKAVITSISNDLDHELENDPKLSITMSKSHRLFNKKWLNSEYSSFELVGVVNRLDRAPFETHSCGELRLIYRLAYKVKKIHSRLPLTINLVFHLNEKEETCQSIAKKLTKNVNLKNYISAKKLKSLELNLQAIRWPSTIRPDMGGYAEYFLRVFKRENNSFRLATLENTPDLEKLKDQSLKLELHNWILTNLDAIDKGIATVPEKFLATKAKSFAFHGMARLANRPFDQLFNYKDFKDIKFSKYKTIKSPRSLIRRLDDTSCMGCHQNRTVAGFHFLGKDRENTLSINSIFSASSAHFKNDQLRRQEYIDQLVTHNKTIKFRPFSERSESERGSYGAHCALADNAFDDYKTWTCEDGLECRAFDHYRESGIGECLPIKRGKAGDPCQVGVMEQNRNAKKDRIINRRQLQCAQGYHCEVSQVGFPGGMCSNSCNGLTADENCGQIAVLFGFNQCLTRGDKTFFDCLTENVRPGSLRACDDNTFCRDDYICAKTHKNTGVCIPPYFLFQLRVDGHPRI